MLFCSFTFVCFGCSSSESFKTPKTTLRSASNFKEKNAEESSYEMRFVDSKCCCIVCLRAVGYTMRDIIYKWNAGPKSVGIANEVQLPQFRVLGHRQSQTVINLSTGTGTHSNNPPSTIL